MSENYIVINGKRVEFTEEQLKQLGIEIEPVKEERWRAENCEGYWYVSDCGKVNLVNECEMDSDNYRYNSYNYFKTKEAAEKYARVLDTELRLRGFAEMRNVEMHNANTDSTEKWYIEYDCRANELRILWTYYRIFGRSVYFTSRDIVERAIAEIGEDKIKEYFTYEWGVGEHTDEE